MIRSGIIKQNRSLSTGADRWLHKAIVLFVFSIFFAFTQNCSSVNDATDLILFGFTGELTFEESGSPGLTVASLSGGYCLHENSANGTLALTAVLNSQPKSNVTVPLTTNDTGSATVSPASLTFKPANWDTPQNITMAGVSESTVDGNSVGSLVFGAMTSFDPDYNNLTPSPVNGILMFDDEQYSIAVCPPAAGLVTSEDLAQDTFTVVLSRPMAGGQTVTIPATISVTTNGDEAGVSPGTLVFNTSNWFIPQVVTATGIDDLSLDGSINYQVTVPNSTSGDGNFNNLQYFSYHETNNPGGALTNIVYGVNLDNDVPAVTVTPVVRSFNESDAPGSASMKFTVVLGIEPTGPVTISLTNMDAGGRSNMTPAGPLTFTAGACPGPGNWCTPQTVTVDPVQNDIADGNTSFKIVTGVATGYGGIDPADVDVTIYDDDTAGVEVVQLNRNVVESTTQNAFYRLRLTSEPVANVTIPMNDVYDSGAAGLAVKPVGRLGNIDQASVTFTPGNWNVYQNVTFNPVNDNIADGNIQFLVELQNITSTDPKYNGLKPTPNITVNYNDNDVAGFVITANAATTNTGSSAATIDGFATDDSNNLDSNTYSFWQMRLRSEPLADITVVLTVNSSNSDGLLDGVATTKTLTYTTANWNVNQPVFVDGDSDGTNEGSQNYSVNVSSVTGDLAYADGKTGYNSATVVARPSFSIYSCDNDVANLLTGCRRSGSFATSEAGGTATWYFITQSDPGASPANDVCVPVNSSDETEGKVTLGGGVAATVGPPDIGTAKITTGNWNTMLAGGTNNIVVTGQNDILFDLDVTYSLIAGNPTCGSAAYMAFNPADITLTNTEDDVPLEIQNLTNSTEGLPAPQASFRVRLQTGITDAATFSVSCTSGSQECASVSPTSVTIPAFSGNAWQTVTITHIDDNRADGTQSHNITFGAISAPGNNVDGVVPSPANVATNADNDKVIWVTTGLFNPNFNAGLGVADGYCGTDANKPSFGSYKALLADSTTRTATTSAGTAIGQNGWIMIPNTDYYLGSSGGGPFTNKVFTTNANSYFTFGSLTTAFNSTAAGHWTGLNADWTTATNTCTNWTLNDPGPALPTGPPHQTTVGAGSVTNSASINSIVSDCQTITTRHLICVQQ